MLTAKLSPISLSFGGTIAWMVLGDCMCILRIYSCHEVSWHIGICHRLRQHRIQFGKRATAIALHAEWHSPPAAVYRLNRFLSTHAPHHSIQLPAQRRDVLTLQYYTERPVQSVQWHFAAVDAKQATKLELSDFSLSWPVKTIADKHKKNLK